MAETILPPPPPPRRRRRWLRIIGWILSIFIVLLLVAYFVGTSSAFFKSVILPRASKSLNADITVRDASISPFKQVLLKGLKVQTTGSEPLLTADEVRARYSLFDIIGGKLHVDEVTVLAPKINLIENPDGTSNLDPIIKGQKKAEKPAQPKPPGKPEKPAQIDIRKVALTDATILQIQNHPGGKRDVVEVSHLNLTLEDLKNGQTGKSSMSAEVKAEHNPAEGQPGALAAKLNANFTFALTPDLKPGSIKGTARMDVTQATGAMAELASLSQDLNCDISPTEIKEVALHFQRNNARLGEIRIAGPFSVEKAEGRLQIVISSIDRQVLNLAGASSGIDFGSTTINSTNDIQIAKAGSIVTASGRLNLNQFQIIREKQTSPPLDLRADYDVTVDQQASNALLRALTLAGSQRGKSILTAGLSSPMTIAFDKDATNAVGDSSLNINVTGLDLADWKALAGETAPSGIVNLKAKLLSQKAGKELSFDVNGQVDNLTAGSGSNQISQATVTLLASGHATNMSQFKLNDYKVQVARQNKPLVTIAGSGTYDQGAGSADMQLAVQASLANLLAALPRQDIAVSSGTIDFKGHLTQTLDKQSNATQTVTGSLALAELTGTIAKNDFRNFGATMDLDIQADPQQAQIRKLSGKLSEAGNPGGAFDLSGSYGMKNKAAQVTARLTDFSQTGLRAFLEPLLGDKQLASIALNATATAQYNPQGDSSIKADLQVTNLVVKDPQNRFPATPLEARVQLDTALVKQVAEVRKASLTLTPTPKAKNELTLQGRVDMNDTNAFQGNLQVAADSLDVTRYYDLFASEKKSEPAPPGKPASRSSAPSSPPTAPASGPEKEPDPVKLPFRNFTAGVNIGRFYLRELEITNLQTSIRIDGGHVLLDPFKLALNGAPATAKADLDLGVPGYVYDLSLDMNSIPLAPLVNTFQPERKGKVGGTMTALAKIKGKGTTGASLQKNLEGQFDVGSTNLNLSVDNIESRLIRTIVEFVSILPDLANNPTAALTSFGEGLFGSKEGGLSSDLRKSPIDIIEARGTAGAGKVELKQSVIQSPAFRAEAAGTITLAPVLTNSTLSLPVSLWLERSLAEKVKRLLAADIPPDAKYAKLPDLLTVEGTLGIPKKKINKGALTGTALKGISAIPGLNTNTQNLLQGVGGFLSGQRSDTNAPNATTNSPNSTTNQPPSRSVGNDLLNLLNKATKPKK